MAMPITMRSLANAVLLLCLALAFCCEAQGLAGATGLPGRHFSVRDPNEKVFNVLQFGAVPNGRKDSSLSIIKAWRAACDTPGKSRVVIPVGNFVAGPIIFEGPCKGPITVQFAGNLKALSDTSSYVEDYWIMFENVNGLVVTGSGTIDGQGATVWEYHDESGLFPANVKFNHVSNAIIRQITSLNPMGFHMAILLCNTLRVQNIHLSAPADSPNTDGIHISQSSAVKVARSVISTGDDCVGIIQGSTDISVKKVTCGPGHGISIGSLGKYENEKDVRGIVVKNCTLKDTQNGVRIKTWGGSPPSAAADMTFADIVMQNVKNPIIIDQSYGTTSKGPSRVKLSDIRYINIQGTTVSNNAVDLECSSSLPCERILLSNINLKYTGPKPLTSTCLNAKVSYAGLQFPPPCR